MTDPSAWPGLEGRVVLVVGGAGGIGRAIVSTLSASGARVAALDRSDEAHPAAAESVAVDLGIERDVKAAVARVREQVGPIGVLVFAAGRTGAGPLAGLSLADWDAVLRDNLTCAFLLCREVYPDLKDLGGNVVLIGSIRGHEGGATTSGPAYAAAKAGIANLGRYLAKEWAPDRIRANVVVPGAVDTPMLRRLDDGRLKALRANVPLQKFATPDEVAAAVAFLASTHAASITGALVNVSNGEWIG